MGKFTEEVTTTLEDPAMDILVLFDSKGGHTYELAKAVADGISTVDGVAPRIRRPKETTPIDIIRANEQWSQFHDRIIREVEEVTLDDMVETEGLAMGSPTRYGNMTPAMGNFIESTGPLWAKGQLLGRVAGVFTSTNTMHGGQETTLISMMIPLMHLGYIIVPLSYSEPDVLLTQRGGTPYGPSSVSGPKSDQYPDELELGLAKIFGKRLAEVTKKVRSVLI